jgi:hypothetical protein
MGETLLSRNDYTLPLPHLQDFFMRRDALRLADGQLEQSITRNYQF